MSKKSKPEVRQINHRNFPIDFSTDTNTGTDAKTGEIILSAASDIPYLRSFGYEVLSMASDAVDMSRLSNKAAVLVDHEGDQVGVVDKAWIDGNKLRASVRFSKSQRGQDVEQDIRDGIRANVSIGYEVLQWDNPKNRNELDGAPVYTAVKWQPAEISIVSVPADYTVGVGRKKDTSDDSDSDDSDSDDSTDDDSTDDSDDTDGPAEEERDTATTFVHNSKLANSEPTWSSVDKTALPQIAFAGKGDDTKKSTWSYPHHWIQDAAKPDADGIWTEGTMFLHQGGLNAAWAAAQGAHSGDKASPAIVAHLQAHRDALAKAAGAKSHAEAAAILKKDMEDCLYTADVVAVESTEEVKPNETLLIDSAVNDTENVESGAGIDTADAPAVEAAKSISHITITERTKMKDNADEIVNPNINLDTREQKTYSLSKAILGVVDGDRSGWEFDVSDEIAKKTKRNDLGKMAFSMPTSLNSRTGNIRAIDIGTVGGGQELAAIEPGPFVDFLRNRTVVGKLGATTLTLSQKTFLPQQTNDPTATWIAEDSTPASATSQSFAQIVLSPRKLVAQTAFSIESLRAGSYDIESIVRQNLYNVFATTYDLAALTGNGGSTPTGLLNYTGLVSGSHTSGSALTYGDAVQCYTNVVSANADMGSMAYLTSPKIFGEAASTIRSGSTAQFIINDDRQIMTFPVEMSNNLTANTFVFGDWSSMILAEFGAIDIIVDPYTRANYGQVVITAQMLGDVNFRHIASFAIQKNVV